MIEQLSPEWFAARLGRVTASRLADVVAETRSGWGASRAQYMADLIVERLTGQPTQRYQTDAMRWGLETEPDAIAAYEFFTDNAVEPASFISHPEIEMSGASPDGLVGEDGLVEVKCPTSAVHIDVLLDGLIQHRYRLQMLWQLACTGRKWVDFVSFDPRMPEGMKFFLRRVGRDDEQIALLEKNVRLFLSELDTKLDALVSRYGDGEGPLLARLKASVA